MLLYETARKGVSLSACITMRDGILHLILLQDLTTMASSIVTLVVTRGPFLESPGNFSGPEPYNLFYQLRILLLSFRSQQNLSLKLKHPAHNSSPGPISYRDFPETGLRAETMSGVALTMRNAKTSISSK